MNALSRESLRPGDDDNYIINVIKHLHSISNVVIATEKKGRMNTHSFHVIKIKNKILSVYIEAHFKSKTHF